MNRDTGSEAKLRELIEGNSEANRARWALEWKKQGRKVMGVFCSYVPEEVISAAGMLPWRVTGTWQTNVSLVAVYRGDNSCGYCTHALESLLSGQLNFLDGIITSDLDQDLLRMWDVWVSTKKTPFCHAMHIPYVDSELNYQFLTKEIGRLISRLEELGGVKITKDSLHSSIDTYNKMRTLLTRVYELRKREVPPLSGAEVLGVTTAARVMPKEQFNRELEALLPYLEKRTANLKHIRPRILVTSEMLDNPAYLQIVEEGSLVAMDDLDTGSRYFIQTVDTTLKDPAYALAKRYISRHGAPRMTTWDNQVKQILKWVKEFSIDGVVGLPQSYCYPQMYRMPFLKQKLDEAGIPNVSFERDYPLTNVGQLRTRIGAFLEMLEV